MIKQKASKHLDHRKIESLCLYLKKQKRALDDYHWEFYDKQTQLIDTLLRPIFLCLDFEATDKSYALTAQLSATKVELLADALPRTYDRRLIPNRQIAYLTNDNDNVIPSRFEWLLYLQIPNKLKGQLHVPGTVKYRALNDDLIGNTRWKTKKMLLKQSMLPRMKEKPNQLVTALSSDLRDKLRHVSQRIENGDNQNAIMSNRSGKITWRLLSGRAKNHPLLQALTEYNRMIKATYLLEYIDDESLRSYVQRALNRGEAYHQLRRAVASVNGNRFRGISDYEIDLWN